MLFGNWIDLGTIDYSTAWQIQQDLAKKRKSDEIPNTLLLCEHLPVITVGRRKESRENILDPDRFPIYEVERGGDVTYHGPGQLVGYPILKLSEEELNPHSYLRKLEIALIKVCSLYRVHFVQKNGFTGVWTADGNRKIASLGVAIRSGVTLHGFALNISTDLSHFKAIVACGIKDVEMTSLEREINIENINLSTIKEEIAQEIGKTFRTNFTYKSSLY